MTNEELYCTNWNKTLYDDVKKATQTLFSVSQCCSQHSRHLPPTHIHTHTPTHTLRRSRWLEWGPFLWLLFRPWPKMMTSLHQLLAVLSWSRLLPEDRSSSGAGGRSWQPEESELNTQFMLALRHVDLAELWFRALQVSYFLKRGFSSMLFVVQLGNTRNRNEDSNTTCLCFRKRRNGKMLPKLHKSLAKVSVPPPPIWTQIKFAENMF